MSTAPADHSRLFLRSWVRNPAAVGLPFVSTRWTARRLARAALAKSCRSAGPIVELGGGTGAVTAALLEAGCAAREVVVIERDAELCHWLRQSFSGVRVLHADALKLAATMDAAGIHSIGGVVSGLPMRAIAPEKGSRCYEDAFARMPPEGAIIQYTYGFRPPLDPEETNLLVEARFLAREWRNVPPIAIWSYQSIAMHPRRKERRF